MRSGYIIAILMIITIIITGGMMLSYHSPQKARTSFDNTCKVFFKHMIKDGGLSSENETKLRTQLEKRFRVVSIKATKSAGWGKLLTLEVKVEYTFKPLKYNESVKDEILDFKYYNESYSMILLEG